MNRAMFLRLSNEMIKWVIALLTIFVLLFQSNIGAEESDTLLGPPPGSYKIMAPDGQIRIPFEMYRGDIRIMGEINGREVRMLIDNGFLWDPILFFGSPGVDSLNLNIDGTAEVSGSGDGDAVASTTASGITISFPGVEFYDQTAIITPYSSGVAKMWHGAEGQVSATFLKHFVVDVNYDEMIITLIEPEKFEYSGIGIEVPMKHLFSNSWSIPAEIEMTDGRIVELDLAMDLGYGDALQLAEGYEHELTVPSNAIEASLGFGIQGETRGFMSRVKSVKIGSYGFDNVITAFVPEKYCDHIFHEATIGLGMLQRFNFIYDYPSHRMFLEPNKNFGEPFEYNMSGMVIRRGDGAFMQIITLYPDSPADKAGLDIGDKITRINDRPSVDYDIWELIPLMRQEGAAVKLTVLKDGKEKDISITLKPII